MFFFFFFFFFFQFSTNLTRPNENISLFVVIRKKICFATPQPDIDNIEFSIRDWLSTRCYRLIHGEEISFVNYPSIRRSTFSIKAFFFFLLHITRSHSLPEKKKKKKKKITRTNVNAVFFLLLISQYFWLARCESSILLISLLSLLSCPIVSKTRVQELKRYSIVFINDSRLFLQIFQDFVFSFRMWMIRRI